MQVCANLKNAHICRIWALLIICGSVVVVSAVSILQGICKAGIGYADQLSVASLQLPVGFAPLAVDLGGESWVM